jgi:hypothetical protein
MIHRIYIEPISLGDDISGVGTTAGGQPLGRADTARSM